MYLIHQEKTWCNDQALKRREISCIGSMPHNPPMRMHGRNQSLKSVRSDQAVMLLWHRVHLKNTPGCKCLFRRRSLQHREHATIPSGRAAKISCPSVKLILRLRSHCQRLVIGSLRGLEQCNGISHSVRCHTEEENLLFLYSPRNSTESYEWQVWPNCTLVSNGK